jgi:hypothetical protein
LAFLFWEGKRASMREKNLPRFRLVNMRLAPRLLAWCANVQPMCKYRLYVNRYKCFGDIAGRSSLLGSPFGSSGEILGAYLCQPNRKAPGDLRYTVFRIALTRDKLDSNNQSSSRSPLEYAIHEKDCRKRRTFFRAMDIPCRYEEKKYHSA